MYKFQNHIEMLEGLEEARALEIKTRGSYVEHLEAVAALNSIYTCLDINELKSIVKDFQKMNRRLDRRTLIKKNVA